MTTLDALLQADVPDEQKAKALEPFAPELGCSPWTELYLRKFLSQDSEILRLKAKVRLLSKVRDSVIIYGETGTGKQLIAQALHGSKCENTSLSSPCPFVHLNCAGLPETLLESELFGHVRGAFSGAVTDKQGLLLSAKSGTLFLDEIGELPPGAQAKLLTVLQERVCRPVGSNYDIPVSCRVLAATHHHLPERVRAGAFREDLYMRLGTFELKIPSLADRGNAEVLFITQALCPDFPLVNISGIHLAGNVRSIQRAIRRWKVLGQ